MSVSLAYVYEKIDGVRSECQLRQDQLIVIQSLREFDGIDKSLTSIIDDCSSIAYWTNQLQYRRGSSDFHDYERDRRLNNLRFKMSTVERDLGVLIETLNKHGRALKYGNTPWWQEMIMDFHGHVLALRALKQEKVTV